MKWVISPLKIQFEKIVPYLRMIRCFPKKVKQEKKTDEEAPSEAPDQVKEYKHEWALDSKGSLMVYLKP